VKYCRVVLIVAVGLLLAPLVAEGQQAQRFSGTHWRDLLLFYEYFHGDNGAGIGASHQTGWTGLVAKLLQQSGE
jgi:hypothetical protein